MRRIKQTKLYSRYLQTVLWKFIRSYRRFLLDPLYDWKCERFFRATSKNEYPLLQEARLKYESQYQSRQLDPLVSVVIATYNRGELLVERALPSVLNQTYQNFEIVIVGDCCTDNTPALLAEINDPRIRFYNKPIRGPYPETAWKRYKVVGIPATNQAIALAQGQWITHLDDDDEYTPDHIEILLRHAQSNNLEFVFGQSRKEIHRENWKLEGGPHLPNGYPPFRRRKTHTTHSAIFYRTYLRLFKYSMTSWQLRLGSDTHRYMRMSRAGIRSQFIPHVVTQLPLRPGEYSRGWLIQEKNLADAEI